MDIFTWVTNFDFEVNSLSYRYKFKFIYRKSLRYAPGILVKTQNAYKGDMKCRVGFKKIIFNILELY